MRTDSSAPEPDPPDAGLIDRLAAIDDSLSGRGCSAPTVISAAEPGGAKDDALSLEGAVDAILLLRQAAAADMAAQPAAEDIPETVSRFQVMRVAGRGGFAVVLEAYDPVLTRPVAVKLAHPDALLSQEARGRFVREAELAARLTHPHIVAIHEVGEADGRMFIAEEFCAGGSLAEWLETHPGLMAPHVAAHLIRTLAQAAAHAHGHGIVHRDIKPANVLLTRIDATTGDTGLLPEGGLTAKLCDFGLAKAFAAHGGTEANTQATVAGLRIGTPAWMAPEQIDSSFGPIGPATDVHALGLLLHRLLTGCCPSVGLTDAETFKRILVEEPTSPDRIVRNVPGDLAAVCLKCLAKQPAERYGTATDLAADLSRFLNGTPTVARPLTPATRLLRAVRRRPMVAGLVATAVAALATAMWSAHERAVETAQRLEHAADVRSHEAAAELRRGFDAWRTGNASRALDHLSTCATIDPSLADSVAGHWLRRRTHGEQAVVVEVPRRDDGSRPAIHSIALSPDGHTLAAGTSDGTLLIADAAGNAAVRDHAPRLVAAHDEINSLDFSPDGRLIATVGQDGRLRVWTTAGDAAGAATSVGSPLYGVSFSADGQSIVFGGADRIVRAIEVAVDGGGAGQPRVVHDCSSATRSDADIEAICRVDGQSLAVACGESLFLVDAVDGVGARSIGDVSRTVCRLAASPDGTRLVCVGHEREPTVWNIGDGTLVSRLPRHPSWVQGCGFSPDGRQIVTGCRDGMARVFDAADGDLRQRLVGHEGRVWDVLFEPQGTILTAGADGTVRRWSPNRAPDVAGLVTSDVGPGSVRCVLAMPPSDGRPRIAIATFAQSLRILSIGPEHAPLASVSPRLVPTAMAYDPPRRRIAVAQEPGPVTIIKETKPGYWDSSPVLSGGDTPSRAVAWTPDGMLLVGCTDGRLLAWDAAFDRVTTIDRFEKALGATSGCPTGDGRVAAGSFKELAVYKLQPPARVGEGPVSQRLFRIDTLPGDIHAIAWSPDGSHIACGTNDGFVVLLDAATGNRLGVLAAHEHDLLGLAYSPDGRTLVSADAGSVRFSDAITLALFDELRPGWRITSMHLSEDGSTVAIGGEQAVDGDGATAPLGRLGIIDLGRAPAGRNP